MEKDIDRSCVCFYVEGGEKSYGPQSKLNLIIIVIIPATVKTHRLYIEYSLVAGRYIPTHSQLLGENTVEQPVRCISLAIRPDLPLLLAGYSFIYARVNVKLNIFSKDNIIAFMS